MIRPPPRCTFFPYTTLFRSLKAGGKAKGVLVVAVDGGCPGVKSVKGGVIGATSQQYPLLMASTGFEAINSGYCCEVAPMTPPFTLLTPGQPPSTATTSTPFALPPALRDRKSVV